MEIGFTVVRQKATPLIQLIVALSIGWLGMGIVHFLHVPKGSEYFAAYVGIIFFCLMNTIISVAYKSFLRYTIPSYYIYVLLVAVLLLSAKYLSGLSIWDLWEYRMMLVSTTIFYFIVSLMIRGVRLLYEMAENGF
jgi:hypothetical protein